MGLPFTKNQVRKLGDRLRAAETPDDADLDKLHELLESYDESMSLAEHVLRDELGYAVSSRLKNAGTIVEKLRRNRNSHLGNIQDLAGVRMVMASNDRAEQDAVAEAIMDRFADVSQPPRRTDRRVNPIQGYRALHLVVFVGDLPVEVQIRTSLQQSWAEYFEKLGDFFGREIRYGESLKLDHMLVSFNLPEQEREQMVRQLEELVPELVGYAMSVSDLIDSYERLPRTVHESDSEVQIAATTIEIMNKLNVTFDTFAEALSR